ncbi:MAG TPA: hypothetical protein DEB35_06610 [Desulfuromonas sp.]|nr:hypothetical protein [Desulfuromonas sp.]
MRLAALAGLDVAPVSLQSAAGKDVLLVERFDRVVTAQGWQRKLMVSALTLLQLDEMMARYASYRDLAELVRSKFNKAPESLRELFSRIVFNVLVGNTDDHARNHAAFWDGERLALTPAYDICPQPRHGRTASQAMLIGADDRSSRIATCIAAAAYFLLSEQEAVAIVEKQIICLTEHWTTICDEAALSEVEGNLLWGNQFLNPYIFEDLPAGKLQKLAQLR